MVTAATRMGAIGHKRRSEVGNLKFYLALLAYAVTVSSAAQTAAPVVESADAAEKLGYSSVAEALQSMTSKPGVQVNVTQPDGWTIVNDPSPVFSVWSFTPRSHPAHPAVVRRTVQQDKTGNVSVEMVALCEAAKEPCDQLIRDFQVLNEQMRERVQRRLR